MRSLVFVRVLMAGSAAQLGCQGAAHSPGGGTMTATPTQPSPAAEAPAPSAAEAPAKLLRLTIDAQELHRANGKVTFSPGSRRQQADYEHYVFDAAAFDRVAGAGAGDFVAEVAVSKTVESTYTPPDNYPSPMGGFRNRQHTATLVRVLERGAPKSAP